MSDAKSTLPGVLVTRPEHQGSELAGAIRRAGGKAFELPVLHIEFRDPEEIARDAARIGQSEIIVFVSRNAVSGGLDTLNVAGATIAAVGPATRRALEDSGCAVHIVPEGRFDSEHLLMHPDLQDVSGKNIAIVRGTHGRELLADTLRERGATVAHLAVYERKIASPDPLRIAQISDRWNRGEIDAVVVMSVESLDGLLRILPDDCLEMLRQSVLVTPSTRVIQTALEQLPGTRAVLADGPDTTAMVATLIESCKETS